MEMEKPKPSSASSYPDDLADAVSAWAALSGEHVAIERITVLKESKKSRVYRLGAVGPGGASVIAKRHAELRTTERKILEAVSPDLPVRLPAFLGSLSAGEATWHFVEDLGSRSFDWEVPGHAEALASWLALIHTTPLVHHRQHLPSRDHEHYLGHLHRARKSVTCALDGATATPEERKLFNEAHSFFEELLGVWDSVALLSRLLPATLLHGDLQPKNILVDAGGTDVQLIVLDWEMSGWGSPAVDIAALDRMTVDGRILSSYWTLLGAHGLDAHDQRRFVLCGGVLRRLAALDWATLSLTFPRWGDKPIRRLQKFSGEIRTLAHALDLPIRF